MISKTEPIWQGYPQRVVHRLLFTGTSGVADEVLDCIEAINFFRLIFTEEFVHKILYFANLFA